MAINSNLAGVARVAFSAETGEFNRDVAQAEQRYKAATHQMSDSAIRLELAQERLRRALAKGPAAYQAIARAELGVRRETASLTAELNKNTGAVQRNEHSVGRFGRGALAGSGAVRGLGRSVAFASGTFLGGAGLAYAFTTTLKAAGEFQRSLNILKVVTGATATQMEVARAKAVELGRDVTLPATSAKDAANAMTTLAKAGLDMQNAIAGSEGVLRLAAAAQIDVATAGGIAAKSIVSFGLAATDTTRVADIFANAANASIGEISDFSLALSQSSTVAKSWGLSIEETVALLANFAQAGIQGSDAGTSLRVMLSRLQPTSANATKAFKELNISAYDAKGQIKPFRETLQNLHKAFEGLTPAQQKLNVQMIFGQDAQRGAGIAILNTIKNYDSMLAKIKETGTAQKYAAAINEGYVGSLDAFRSAVETLQITVGTKLLPVFTAALKSATDWVNGMEKSGTAAHQVETAVSDAADAIKILAAGIGIAKDALQPFVDALGGVTRAMEIAVGLGLARKLAIAARGFGGIAGASAIMRTKVLGDAAAIERALDVATRPRNVIITTSMTPGSTVPGSYPQQPNQPGGIPGGSTVAGAAGAAAASRGSRFFRGRGGVVQRVGQYGKPIPAPVNPASGLPGGLAGMILGSFTIGGGGVEQTEPVGIALDPRSSKWYVVYPNASRIAVSEANAQKAFPGQYREIKAQKEQSAGLRSRPDEGTRARPTGRTRISSRATRATVRAGARGDGLTELQRLDIATSRAGNTPGLADDIAAANREVAYYQKLKNAPGLRGKDLYDATQAVLTAEGKRNSLIEQVEQQRTQKAEESARKREEQASKRAAAAKRLAARQKKIADDAVRFQVQLASGNIKTRQNLVYDPISGMFESIKKQQDKIDMKTGKLKKGGRGLTAADVARQQHDFLVQFEQLTRRFSSNIQRTDTPPVTVNLHSSSPVTDPAEINRGLRYAQFHLRSVIS